jgi:hypothetical protein
MARRKEIVPKWNNLFFSLYCRKLSSEAIVRQQVESKEKIFQASKERKMVSVSSL